MVTVIRCKNDKQKILIKQEYITLTVIQRRRGVDEVTEGMWELATDVFARVDTLEGESEEMEDGEN